MVGGAWWSLVSGLGWSSSPHAKQDAEKYRKSQQVVGAEGPNWNWIYNVLNLLMACGLVLASDLVRAEHASGESTVTAVPACGLDFR